MPTAAEYDAFAVSFSRAGDEVGEIGNAVKAQRHTKGVGGTFGSLVDMTLDTISDRMRRAQPDLDAAAAECRRRANICEQYAEAMRQYREALYRWRAIQNAVDPSNQYCADPGLEPQMPEKPYSWVEI